MASMGSDAQDDARALALERLAVDEARIVDRVQLVDGPGGPTLLYSTQREVDDASPALVIKAAPLADASRAREIARIARLLPAPADWDARPVGDRYEILYEQAGGAVSAIFVHDADGKATRVSVEHPFESFTRPHFVRAAVDGRADVAAVADLKKIVVFPGGLAQPVKYVALADGADGVAGQATDRWVAAKTTLSGAQLFGTLPGRLTLFHIGSGDTRRTAVPDLLAYELDAATLGDDILVFATGRPAVLLLGQRAHRPLRLAAEPRQWLSQLSRPALLVTSQAVHAAAIANAGTEQAAIVYGSLPLAAVAR